eukprot:TRINITY_DN71953_c0_g1_i1.p1 TRINITY_DN71953_c0_g1~~TRINITY_DN71953_c0_g1_i1.p1  ORF type:complete len:129 (+),score=30.73 TRINITY_DN71953_c0_g1_i1:81-467(+)
MAPRVKKEGAKAKAKRLAQEAREEEAAMQRAAEARAIVDSGNQHSALISGLLLATGRMENIEGFECSTHQMRPVSEVPGHRQGDLPYSPQTGRPWCEADDPPASPWRTTRVGQPLAVVEALKEAKKRR